MKFLVALFVVILGVSFIGQSQAWWGGYGLYGSYGLGYGYGGYGLWGKRDTTHVNELNLITECTYLTKTSTLHCTSPSGPIECPAILIEDMSPVQYIQFGLGQLNSSLVFSEDVKFRMFPRKLDQSAWLWSTWMVKDKEFDFSMYYGEKDMGQGIRVTDKVCYEKLFDLLKTSVRSEEVVLQSDLEIKPTVALIGDIFIRESL